MTNTQHTPAPWDVRAQWDGHGVDYYLLNPEQDEKPMYEIYANARLIAAAPELLKALENICKAIDDVSSQIGDFVQYEQARKAISKARGQSC